MRNREKRGNKLAKGAGRWDGRKEESVCWVDGRRGVVGREAWPSSIRGNKAERDGLFSFTSSSAFSAATATRRRRRRVNWVVVSTLSN